MQVRIRRLVLFLFFLLIITRVYAQERESTEESLGFATLQRQIGDYYLQLDLGVFIPMFYTDLGDEFWYASNSVGPHFALGMGAYLTNNIPLGVQIDASFSVSESNLYAFFYELLVRTGYIFRIKSAEIPILLDLGLHVSAYNANSHADFVLKFGTGFLWNFNTNWAFGGHFMYRFVPQIYYSDLPPASDSRLGNFFETLLSVKYSF